MKALIYKGLQSQFWRIVKIEKQIDSRFHDKNKEEITMSEEDVVYTDYDYEENDREGRYYLGDGLWSHPETGGDFYFEDERKNH